jgi:hypothetical protein
MHLLQKHVESPLKRLYSLFSNHHTCKQAALKMIVDAHKPTNQHHIQIAHVSSIKGDRIPKADIIGPGLGMTA